jgi:hypothetical protein
MEHRYYPGMTHEQKRVIAEQRTLDLNPEFDILAIADMIDSATAVISTWPPRALSPVEMLPPVPSPQPPAKLGSGEPRDAA